MTELEITERLILAAEIGAIGNHVGPSPLRAQRLPYVHSKTDMNGWGHKPGDHRSRDPRSNACRLLREDDDAYSSHRDKFFSSIPDDPRSVSEAEEAMGWYSLVENDDHRSALAAWVGCMADNKRRFFKDWCRRTGLSEKTGRKRKDAAITRIHAQLVRSNVQNCDNGIGEGLLDTPETDDIHDNIADDVAEKDGIVSWAAPDGTPDLEFARQPRSKEVITAGEFDWARKRNERRRQQEAKRRKEAA